MENIGENSSQKNLLPLKPGQYPWLFFQHGEEYEKQIFYNIFDPENNKDSNKYFPQLHGKKVIPCCHGWLFLYEDEIEENEEVLDGDGGGEIEEEEVELLHGDGDGEVEEEDEDEDEEIKVMCCLWNPVTLESIPLPSLTLKFEDVIESCILSASPTDNPDGFVMLSIRSVSPHLVMFCKVEDQEWTAQNMTELGHRTDLAYPDFLYQPIFCNGTIYARIFSNKYLVEIDPILARNGTNRQLVMHLHEKLPPILDHSNFQITNLVESCGEIFQIVLLDAGKPNPELSGVDVFKLDISLMEWRKVESFKDRVFFVDTFTAYCCPVMDQEIQGNCIYFIENDNRSIYCLDIEDKTISVSLPDITLEPTWTTPIWLIPVVERNMPRMRKSNHNKVVIFEETQNKEVSKVCKLPFDILSTIVSCLGLRDYMNFRAVNKAFRIAATTVPFTTCCLMICRIGEDICSFLDALHPGKYQLYNPRKSNEVRVCFVREGWCLMAQGEDFVFFWNPFNNKIIELPKTPHKCRALIGGTFSSSPESSDCVVFLISEWHHIFIDSFSMDEGEWDSQEAIHDEDGQTYRGLSRNNNPVLYNDQIFWLDPRGNLGVSKDKYFEFDITPAIESESIYETYLLEGNGKLICMLVGCNGNWVRVFELDLSLSLWVEVDNIKSET